MKTFGIGVIVVALAATVLAVTGPAAADPRAMPGGVLVNVGGRFVHLHCTGHGSPVVVLEAGLGGSSLEWGRVQAQVSTFTQVCSYDRAGYGWSDPADGPRTSADIARDLHAALTRARIPGPFVLVGHSVGGFHVRLFADQYPSEAAALVLVDASHERQIEAFSRPAVHLNTAPGRHFVMLSQPATPPNMPAGVQAQAQALMASAAARSTVRRELAALRRNGEQAHRARLPSDIPLVVVTRGKRVWSNDEYADAREETWMQLQSRLVQLSDNSVHMIAPESGHHVHLDQPQLVTAAIREAISRSTTRIQP